VQAGKGAANGTLAARLQHEETLMAHGSGEDTVQVGADASCQYAGTVLHLPDCTLGDECIFAGRNSGKRTGRQHYQVPLQEAGRGGGGQLSFCFHEVQHVYQHRRRLPHDRMQPLEINAAAEHFSPAHLCVPCTQHVIQLPDGLPDREGAHLASSM
jgi:hypothetical protein